MSMRSLFTTDPALETKGVRIDYGSFRITLARAGGANKKYTKLLEAKTRPHRRAMQTETMQDAAAMALLREVYAEGAIMLWENREKLDKKTGEWIGEFKVGIEPAQGTDLLPFNADNVCSTLADLPDLFADLQEQANKVSLFRVHNLEEDLKN